ncbi:MAG: hypothetical protein WD851_23555 [Pirellulales bacterium]
MDNHTDNGASGWSHHQETDTTRDAGHNSQTTTVSGPEENRRHALAIDSAFESWVENSSSDEIFSVTPNEPGDYYYSLIGNVSRDEESGSSSYSSGHTADKFGLASGGKFSNSSTRTHKVTGPDAPSDSYVYVEYHEDYPGGTHDRQDYDSSELLSQTTRTTSESGTYYDVPLGFGIGLRIQSGDYTVDEQTTLTTRYEFDHETDYTPYGLEVSDGLTLNQLTSQTTITGSYGPGGLTESRDFISTQSDRDYDFIATYPPSGQWREDTTYTTVNVENDNGQFSGLKVERTVFADYLEVNDFDETEVIDIFGGTPPSGPQGQTTKGGYTPGILEVGIAEAAATNLLPGGQQLNALANLLSPIAAAIAALGQVQEEAEDSVIFGRNTRNPNSKGALERELGLYQRDQPGSKLNGAAENLRKNTAAGVETGLLALPGGAVYEAGQLVHGQDARGNDATGWTFFGVLAGIVGGKWLFGGAGDEVAENGGKAADDVAKGSRHAKTVTGDEHHLMTNKNRISKAAGGPFTPRAIEC